SRIRHRPDHDDRCPLARHPPPLPRDRGVGALESSRGHRHRASRRRRARARSLPPAWWAAAAAAVASSSSSTTTPAHAATAGGGGGLASRLAARDPSSLRNSLFNVPPGPQVYPPFMRGTWDVAMTFRGYVFPSAAISKDRIASDLDVPGFQRLSIAMVGDVGREAASYVMDVDPVTGLEDRGTSMSTSIDSHLGYRAVRGVTYDPNVNPNRISIDFVPQRTRNANRIEIFCNARESESVATTTTTTTTPDGASPSSSTSSPSIFVCSEHVRQVTFGLSQEYGVARQVSGNYAHYWTWRGGTVGAPEKMTGNLLTAAYLDAGDPMFFDEPNRPVIVYSHDLVATRRMPVKK
ncbi:hypothetical protein ACHAW5_000492, partial [Stephanodiscus triporus]